MAVRERNNLSTSRCSSESSSPQVHQKLPPLQIPRLPALLITHDLVFAGFFSQTVNERIKMFFRYAIIALAVSFSSISSAQEPCAPTVVVKSGLFTPASGYYSCTVRKHNNNIVTAWTWTDESALLSKHRHKAKYAFACSTRMMKLLERDLSGEEDEEWVKPEPGTVGDKWMISICSSARFL